jgi:hypothetical protein
VASIIASGPQMKTSSMLATGSRALMIGADLVAVDAPLQQVHFLRLAGEDVDQRQAVAVAVLEVLQVLVEHHAGHAAVAVDQRELRFRLFFQRARGDRQDRRDARAGGKADAVDGALLLDHEAAVRRHHLSVSPALMDCAAQLENRPPSTGRMPISSSPSALARRLRGLLIE